MRGGSGDVEVMRSEERRGVVAVRCKTCEEGESEGHPR